jgi:hypothetical protein
VKKIAPKKMTLSRETLGILTDREMKDVMGAATGACSNWCTTSRDVCCP